MPGEVISDDRKRLVPKNGFVPILRTGAGHHDHRRMRICCLGMVSVQASLTPAALLGTVTSAPPVRFRAQWRGSVNSLDNKSCQWFNSVSMLAVELIVDPGAAA